MKGMGGHERPWNVMGLLLEGLGGSGSRGWCAADLRLLVHVRHLIEEAKGG